MSQPVILADVLPDRAPLDPNEKRIAHLDLKTTDPIARCVEREMKQRGLGTVSNMLHIILYERYQMQQQTGRPCRHPVVEYLDRAKQAAEEKARDGRIELHEIPDIERPLAMAQNELWNGPEAA
jgi:hypothetical protein